jgi:hypothetical protein
MPGEPRTTTVLQRRMSWSRWPEREPVERRARTGSDGSDVVARGMHLSRGLSACPDPHQPGAVPARGAAPIGGLVSRSAGDHALG